MPTLTIDNKTVTVPEGTNVLDAAKGVGIVIPHFCYHEALGAVGACRLCAMTFVEGPVKGMQMSCMVKAQDGMVVTTLDERSVDLRKHVIEWLMVNHPHDCPVCDEGGECQLQDMTVAGGHTIRRYRGLKRTYVNQDLGPFVHHEMNRCIQCYRCVRTYQDYCGGTDFGVLGCNQRIYFGRFRDGRLESPFSGNIVDACPTGVFTDKTFRFQARYWDLQEAPSVCPHCSLGCAVIPGARYRELQRVRGGVNRETNGFFICDRGRFGYGHANHPERPRLPRVGEHTVTWSEALETARTRLSEVVARHGAQAVAFLGSPRASLEANRQLLRLAQDLGSDHVVFDAHPGRDRAARTAAALLGEQARSQEEIRGSDCLIFAAILSVIMVVVCVLQPATPPQGGTGTPRLKAFSMLGQVNFLIFILVSLVVAGMMQFYFLGTAQLMQDRGITNKAVPASMAVAQAAQALATLFLLGLLYQHVAGPKWTLVLGAACWLAMYVVYVTSKSRALLIICQSLHGLAYVFFIIAGQMFTNDVADPAIRASAQGLIILVTTGIGLFLGTQLAGMVMDRYSADGKFDWKKVYTVPLLCMLAGVIALAVGVGDPKPASAPEDGGQQETNVAAALVRGLEEC